MDCGILYIATGDKYVAELCRSVNSVRNHMPDIHITTVADRDIKHQGVDKSIVRNDFDYNNGDAIIRPEYMTKNYMLRLDVDTRVLDDLNNMFKILDEFDVALAHNTERLPQWFEEPIGYTAEGVPDAFPHYNGGVILVKNNSTTRRLFSEWREIYKKRASGTYMFNQPALREALYFSDARIATLPPEYNVRINRPGVLNGPVKILHGWHPELEEIGNRLNECNNTRTYTLSGWPIRVRVYNRSILYRLLFSLHTQGIRKTIADSLQYIVNLLRRN